MLLLLSGCSAAPSRENSPRVELPVETYRLENGLNVILQKDARFPLVAVNLWYHVGAADDGPGRFGYAHLFEHMMLQGSRDVPGDPFAVLEAAGATGINGNTDVDRTTFLEDVPPDQLELALWLESDRMGYLPDTLDQRKLSNQIAVVRNERRESREAAPYGMAQEEVLRLLFPEGHPYRAGILGSHDDINAANLDGMKQFFEQFYSPNNASLSIAGNFDVLRTKALIEKYFGSLPRGPEPPRLKAESKPLTAEKQSVLTDSVELPRVYMSWITPAAYTPGDPEATIAARMLGGGRASRLYERLVFDRKIAQSVGASQRSLAQGSIFQIVATAKPGHSAQELEDAIQQEVDLLAGSGPSARELASTKTGVLAVTVKSLELASVVADRLNAYNHYLGKPDYINEDLDRYTSVSAASLQEFVHSYLAASHRAVVQVNPGERTLPPEPPVPPPYTGPVAPVPPSPEPWRAELPKAGPAPALVVPVADHFRLDNGLNVYHVESRALPLVTARLSTPFGSASDPPGMPGLAYFTTSMLDEGTTKRDSVKIQRDLAALGSTIETGAAREESWMVIQSLASGFGEALNIMGESVTSPSYRPEDAARVRNNLLVSLQQQRDDKVDTASKVMWRELYGAGHPFGHTPLGTEESLGRIAPDDLRRFHDRAFTPGNAVLVLTGDLSRPEARKLAGKAFGSWKGEADPPPAPPAAAPGTDRILIVDKPGSPQTELMVAQTGVARTDPAWEKVSLMNQTLGGLFSSRLNQELRQTEGLTYGLDSDQIQSHLPGPYRISTLVDAQFTGAAVGKILAGVAQMKQAGVTADELQASRAALTRTIPAMFQTNGATASTVAALHLYGLPVDYYRGRPKRVASIDRAAIADLAAGFLRPEEMKIVAVGDRAVIEPQLAALNLGPIGYRNADGS